MCFESHQNMPLFSERGFTLIEVLVTIVVIGIAATSIMSLLTSSAKNSVNPMIQRQAIAIAESYMEEILSKQYCNDPPAEASASTCASEVVGGGREAAETTRALFNDVQDYKDATIIDATVRDQSGQAISDLAGYSVSVAVTADTLDGVDVMRIDVSVDHAVIAPIVLSAYRGNF